MLNRDLEQKFDQLEAKLSELVDRVSGLAGDSAGGSPQPELAQRVYRLEERVDNLVTHLAGTLGLSPEPTPNERETP